jgi:hypothetical protein
VKKCARAAFYVCNKGRVGLCIGQPAGATMDSSERIKLIRLGNELFNKKDIDGATKIFVNTGYRDGITRVADYYFYDRKMPLVALRYYRMVNRQDKVREIFERMVFALGRLLGKNTAPKVELPPLKVSPKLKILAEEILQREKQ